MRTIITSVFLLTIIVSTFLAQARKIDEIGKIESDDLMHRASMILDYLAQDKTAQGYVIVYRSKNEPIGFPLRFAERLRLFYPAFFSTSANRVRILSGGLSDEQKTEIWFVPGETHPPLSESVKEKIDLSQSVEFDDFDYPAKFNDGCCIIDNFRNEEKKASLDEFARLLKEHLNLDGYLIFYGQHCEDCGYKYPDSTATINRILLKEKNYLVKTHKIDISRIKTINGGYREWQAIELWLIPKGEKPPKPTPKTFPKKKIRKKSTFRNLQS